MALDANTVMLGSSLESTKSTHLQNTAADESSSISHPSDRRSLALGMASVKDKEWPFAEIEALTLRLDGSITGAQLAGSRRLCITTDGGKLCTYKLSENMDVRQRKHVFSRHYTLSSKCFQ